MHPQPPHRGNPQRRVVEDQDATQPAVEEDESADETTEDEDEKEVAPVVEPIQSDQRKIAKRKNTSAFPSLDDFIRTGSFRRPDASTPEGRDEAKRFVERMLSTGKMHPELLKMWRSRDVKADTREEALSYDKETKSRDEVYDVSDKQQKEAIQVMMAARLTVFCHFQMFRDANIGVQFLEKLVRDQMRAMGMKKYKEDRTPKTIKNRLNFSQVGF